MNPDKQITIILSFIVFVICPLMYWEYVTSPQITISQLRHVSSINQQPILHFDVGVKWNEWISVSKWFGYDTSVSKVIINSWLKNVRPALGMMDPMERAESIAHPRIFIHGTATNPEPIMRSRGYLLDDFGGQSLWTIAEWESWISGRIKAASKLSEKYIKHKTAKGSTYYKGCIVILKLKDDGANCKMVLDDASKYAPPQIIDNQLHGTKSIILRVVNDINLPFPAAYVFSKEAQQGPCGLDIVAIYHIHTIK